jgi:hypothetical protein
MQAEDHPDNRTAGVSNDLGDRGNGTPTVRHQGCTAEFGASATDRRRFRLRPKSTVGTALAVGSLRTGIPEQLYARRASAQRMAPLDCGCRDPLACRCTQPALSDQMIDAGAKAARHILEIGQIPLLEIEILRALYRRGGDDRALAEHLHPLTGGAVT